MGISQSLFGYRVNLKRIWTSNDENSETNDEDEEIQKPVRKRLKTADYIYEHLFVNGEGSDILIKAIDCEWKLHRVYLAQSPYFSSMFSGKWRESNFQEITVDFPDRQITTESLTTVFGSLYKDAIDIDLTKVIGLVATSMALQLENVTQQCAEVMTSNISHKTIHSYWKASLDYGLKDVEQQCRRWFHRNLLHFSSNPRFLKKISPTLMAELIGNPELYVVQGEMDVYWLLKKWMYVRLHSSIESKMDLKTAAEEYFSSFEEGGASFLETPHARAFVPVFKYLRLHHILSASKSYQTVLDDGIIPKDIIDKVMIAQWRRQLALDSEPENGESDETMDEDVFHQKAMRCGRVLPNDNAFCWRWSGYFFGVDILLNYKNRTVSIKRNCGSQPAPYTVNLKAERKFCYKLSVVKFNEKRQETWCLKTGLKWANLKAEETLVVARIPSAIQFPLTIIFNFITIPFVEDFASDVLATSWSKYASLDNVSASTSRSSYLDDEEEDSEDGEEEAGGGFGGGGSMENEGIQGPSV